MAEVPDHLVPTDGLTDSYIHFGGMDCDSSGGGATMRFDVYDEHDAYITTLKVHVQPTQSGTVDAMIAQAYVGLTDTLRQWLYEADKMRQAYESKASPKTPPTTQSA